MFETILVYPSYPDELKAGLTEEAQKTFSDWDSYSEEQRDLYRRYCYQHRLMRAERAEFWEKKAREQLGDEVWNSFDDEEKQTWVAAISEQARDGDVA